MFGTLGQSFRVGQRPGKISDTFIATTAQIWYDAASPTYFQPTNPINGDLISQWNDRSVAAHNAAPSGGANKPVYVTPSQNGYGAVSFNGTGQNLVVNAGPVPNWSTSKSGFTMFVVAKTTNLTGARYLSISDTNGFGIYFNGSNWAVAAAGGVGVSSVTGDTTMYHIYTLNFNGTLSGNDQRLRFRFDKTAYPLNFGSTTVGALTSSTTRSLYLGWNGSAGYLQGFLAEVLLFTYSLDSTQITAVEGYLSNKWAL